MEREVASVSRWMALRATSSRVRLVKFISVLACVKRACKSPINFFLLV